MRSPVLTGSCHCGAIRIALPRRPRSLTACNCSICRRYGALWAYYRATSVRLEREPGATAEYAWGDRTIRFVRCATCGCVTHWEDVLRAPDARVGVNARMFDPEVLGEVPIRRLDGARTWKYLDSEADARVARRAPRRPAPDAG